MRQVERGHGHAVPPPRDARPRARRRPGARHRRPQPGHRRDRAHVGDAVCSGHRRLRQRLLPLDQRQGLQRHRDLARHKRGARFRQPLLHADPPDLHPGLGRAPVEAHADEREPAQRRARLGAEDAGATSARPADPRGRARLLPRAALPELRQPRAARRRLARRQGGLRRGAAASATGLAVYLDFADAIARSARTSIRERYGNLFQMYERDHRRGPLQACRCGSTRPSTTRWAACGWTTT